MRVSPLNLISTPVPVLNSLGLNLRVGLSSEDPMVGRHPSEAYEAYLSVYSPEGLLLERMPLGQISPNRRRFFDISGVTRRLVPELDHLTVVHRIPSWVLAQVSDVAKDEIEVDAEPDYSYFRSLVEYSVPQGGNGSVIYETPPRLNAGVQGQRSSNTLTFTCQTILSDVVNSCVILIHYSVDPSYSHVASYNYALYSLGGDLVASGRVAVGPFAINVLDMAQIIPADRVNSERDLSDGLSAFTFVGYCDDAALQVFVVNVAPSLGAVAVEHTHPPQTYVLPLDAGYQRTIKTEAQSQWRSVLSEQQARIKI